MPQIRRHGFDTTEFEKIRARFQKELEERQKESQDGQKFLPTNEASHYFQLPRSREELKRLCQLTLECLKPQGTAARGGESVPRNNSLSGAPPRKRQRIESQTPQQSSSPSPGEDSPQEAEDGIARDQNIEEQVEIFVHVVIGEDAEDGGTTGARVKILATLIFSGVRLDWVPWRSFVRNVLETERPDHRQFCDTLLPFKRPEVTKYFGSDDKLNGLILWHQFTMCSPVIEDGHQSFNENIVWPFEQMKTVRSVSGRGKVFEVKVALGHFHGKTNKGWLFKKDLDSSAHDADIARQLSKNHNKSDNVIETRATVDMGGTTSILMECADGTLHELMEWKALNGTKFSNGAGFDEKVDLIRKLIDVGRWGLDFLHRKQEDPQQRVNLLGVHMDFGPRNILVVKEGQKNFTLKISDFGSSCLQSVGAGEISARTRHTQGEQCECLPPEGLSAIHPTLREPVTWRYDVFPFACVFCMYLAWLWKREKGYEEFRNIRRVPRSNLTSQPENERFFVEAAEVSETVTSGGYTTTLQTEERNVDVTFEVNPAVVQYFEDIRDGEDGRQRERELYWNLFEALREMALVPDPQQRHSMTKVCDRLDQVIKELDAISTH